MIVRKETGGDQVVVATLGSLSCSGGRWDPKAATRIGGMGAIVFHQVPVDVIRSSSDATWPTDVEFFENPQNVVLLQAELTELCDKLGNADTEDVAAPPVKYSGKSSSLASSWDQVSQLVATLGRTPAGSAKAGRRSFNIADDEEDEADDGEEEEAIGDMNMRMVMQMAADRMNAKSATEPPRRPTARIDPTPLAAVESRRRRPAPTCT